MSSGAPMELLEAEPRLGTSTEPTHTSVPTPYDKRLMVFAGRGSQELGHKIAGKLGLALGQVELKTFSNGEVYCRYQESIRGADVFIVQSTHAPVNRNLMELLLMIDAAKGASAHRIIAVTPWYGYSRQDKKSMPREPISARLVARMLETAGADRVLTMHLHAGQVQGFFQVPVDHLIARPMLTQYFLDKLVPEEYVVVSPDAGRAKLAEKFAGELGVRPAFITKSRPEHNIAEAGYVVGDVEGRAAIIVDDMIDTAGTLVEAARVLREAGAARVYATATHGVFSGPAFERLSGPEIEELVVTDTIPLPREALDKIKVLSVADILARSIRSIFTDGSVSELFAGENQLF
ncbi:MAG TPA: ribose-phosphate pyrophosphokinase [Solirubrobacterales bacterium]|nr:ribose-phosphate pyrophosphokinase [Solirubrobacterales bacterium]